MLFVIFRAYKEAARCFFEDRGVEQPTGWFTSAGRKRIAGIRRRRIEIRKLRSNLVGRRHALEAKSRPRMESRAPHAVLLSRA